MFLNIIDIWIDFQVIHNFSSAIVVLSLIRYAYHSLPKVFTELKGAYCHLWNTTEAQGTVALLVQICSKLLVPTHFFLFWSIAFFAKLYENSNNESKSEWYVSVLSAASAVCTSPVSLFSTAVAVTYMSYFLLSAMKFFLWG